MYRYCPICRQEFTGRAVTCPDCGTTLVDDLPTSRPPPRRDFVVHHEGAKGDLVTVLSTGNELLLRMVQSALDAEGIPSFAKNVSVQDLFGLGRIGGFNLITGPMEIQVRAENAETARECIAGLEVSMGEGPGEPEDDTAT